MDYTTIRIKKEVRNSLKGLKITKLETYDEILERLITESKQKNEQAA